MATAQAMTVQLVPGGATDLEAVMDVMTSAPITITFECAPDSTNCAPTVRA